MNKFDTVINETVRRYNRSDFLTGDIVKFTKKALNSDWAKSVTQGRLDQIKKMMDSGDVLRVSVTKYVRGNKGEDGINYIDVVREISPGLYTDIVTVPQDSLELVKDEHSGNGRAQDPINPKQRREGQINIKPTEVDAQDSKTSTETAFGTDAAGADMIKQTGVSIGDKSLGNKNINQKFATTKGSKLSKNIASYMDGH